MQCLHHASAGGCRRRLSRCGCSRSGRYRQHRQHHDMWRACAPNSRRCCHGAGAPTPADHTTAATPAAAAAAAAAAALLVCREVSPTGSFSTSTSTSACRRLTRPGRLQVLAVLALGVVRQAQAVLGLAAPSLRWGVRAASKAQPPCLAQALLHAGRQQLGQRAVQDLHAGCERVWRVAQAQHHAMLIAGSRWVQPAHNSAGWLQLHTYTVCLHTRAHTHPTTQHAHTHTTHATTTHTHTHARAPCRGVCRVKRRGCRAAGRCVWRQLLSCPQPEGTTGTAPAQRRWPPTASARGVGVCVCVCVWRGPLTRLLPPPPRREG
jgi:hypothetical protein